MHPMFGCGFDSLWSPQDEETVLVKEVEGKRRSRRERTSVRRYDPRYGGGDRHLWTGSGRESAPEPFQLACCKSITDTEDEVRPAHPKSLKSCMIMSQS